jgi:DNA/RNA-binding domain of Phe-tRNA-synthetase-like protein
MTFTLAPDLAPVIQPAALMVEGVAAVERDGRLDAAVAEAEARARLAPPAEREAVRAMYRRVGLDPTKRRPSSEALLRRIARGEPLPRINSLVDICNWCSLELQLPYGLYDADRIDGDVVLRLGEPGEDYPGIRKDAVHVGGRLTLADRLGPFGNPSSDSLRTMVTLETTRVMAVIFAPRATAREAVVASVDLTSERIRRYAGGVERQRVII